MKKFPIETLEQMILNVQHGAKKLEIESKDWRIKVYIVNSSAKYIWPSIRVDIQDLTIEEVQNV